MNKSVSGWRRFSETSIKGDLWFSLNHSSMSLFIQEQGGISKHTFEPMMSNVFHNHIQERKQNIVNRQEQGQISHIRRAHKFMQHHIERDRWKATLFCKKTRTLIAQDWNKPSYPNLLDFEVQAILSNSSTAICLQCSMQQLHICDCLE